MDNRPIGVYDSGIGGLNVLGKLSKALPKEDFIYLGDNDNVPYGNKTCEQLNEIIHKNINILKSNDVKSVVLACNTASFAVGDKNFINDIKIFKLTPFISERYRNKKGCFIGTPFTVSKIKCSEWAKGRNLMDFIPLENLAKQIEEMMKNGANSVRIDHHLTTEKKYDYLYLGCTHYLFIKNNLASFFNVNIVLDGINNLTENISYYLENNNITAENIQTIKFVGKNAKFNEKVFAKIQGGFF